MRRSLHPLVWWIWSGSLAIAIAKTSSILFSGAVVGVVAIVVKRKSENAPWSRTFYWSLRMGIWVIAIRVLVGIAIGVPGYGKVLFSLPTIGLPTWMAGIRLGGPVTLERLSSTAHEGFMFAAIIALLGAAASLSSPHRLLRSLPVMVYEFGVAIVIATSVLPQLVTSSVRIREAQRLRGQDSRRLLNWRRVALPLLEDSLSRSLELAAAMDSRGYGYSRKRSRYRANSWSAPDFLISSTALLSIRFPMAAIVAVLAALLIAPREVQT